MLSELVDSEKRLNGWIPPIMKAQFALEPVRLLPINLFSLGSVHYCLDGKNSVFKALASQRSVALKFKLEDPPLKGVDY